MFDGNSYSFLYQLSNKTKYFNRKGKMSHLLEIHGDGKCAIHTIMKQIGLFRLFAAI